MWLRERAARTQPRPSPPPRPLAATRTLPQPRHPPARDPRQSSAPCAPAHRSAAMPPAVCAGKLQAAAGQSPQALAPESEPRRQREPRTSPGAAPWRTGRRTAFCALPLPGHQVHGRRQRRSTIGACAVPAAAAPAPAPAPGAAAAPAAGGHPARLSLAHGEEGHGPVRAHRSRERHLWQPLGPAKCGIDRRGASRSIANS